MRLGSNRQYFLPTFVVYIYYSCISPSFHPCISFHLFFPHPCLHHQSFPPSLSLPTHNHTSCPTSSNNNPQWNKQAVKEKEEENVLIWRNRSTAAVLQCLVDISNNTIYPKECCWPDYFDLPVSLFIFAVFCTAFFMCF